MSSTGSRISRLFPYTPWGLTLLAAGTGVLVLGAARMELGALIWGSAFVLLALYALAGGHLTRRTLRRHIGRTLEALDFRLPVDGLFPGDEGTAEVVSELPRVAVPGFQVRFEASLRWQERPPFRLVAVLPPGRHRSTLVFRAPPRGLYRSETVCLDVRDVLGFTRSELVVPLAEQLRVFPAVRPEELKISPRNGGEELLQRLKRRRSDELLEVRKYYPGDDLRRIHWKLFAHVKELFLRMGEENPPPESRFLAVLDLSPSPWLPSAAGADMLDGMVEACASGLLALLSQGLQAQFAVTDRRRLLPVSFDKMERVLELASELWWNERFELELPRSGRREVLLYSLPGSERQTQLLRTCASRNWNVHLFLKDLPPEAPPSDRQLRRVFLREPAAREGQLRLSREARRRRLEQRRLYRQCLEETEVRLARSRTVHVARV
jgi:uncharacterized protein (DUF58 family)